jgi:hypothetical protein
MCHNEDGVLADWYVEPQLAQGTGHAQIGFKGFSAASPPLERIGARRASRSRSSMFSL